MNPNNITLAYHERYMRRCIELAHIAYSRNNTPVGSVIVVGGKIVGEGVEELPTGTSITGHAEAISCQEAINTTGNKLLADATLYTTAEPCFMCSYIIRQCRIALVVYGVETPHIGGITSSLPVLIDASLSAWAPAPRVLAGVLIDECEKLKLAIRGR